MQTTAKAAVNAAQKSPLDVSNTSQLRDLAQSAARVFGWDNNDKPGVQLNQQFVISQEQLEQIRALRAVPEPEQLQEGKNNEHRKCNDSTPGIREQRKRPHSCTTPT
jgi:hypothetical protein